MSSPTRVALKTSRLSACESISRRVTVSVTDCQCMCKLSADVSCAQKVSKSALCAQFGLRGTFTELSDALVLFGVSKTLSHHKPSIDFYCLFLFCLSMLMFLFLCSWHCTLWGTLSGGLFHASLVSFSGTLPGDHRICRNEAHGEGRNAAKCQHSFRWLLQL